MEQCPDTKIYNLIRTTKVVKHKKRQEFLIDLIKGVIKSRSVVFSEIADKIDKDIKTTSIERRIQDFFQKTTIDYQSLAIFLLSFVHHEKLDLTIDRTEWDFGETQINILCVVASVGKMAIPLYFEMLDNNSGNSGWEDRIEILKSLIGVIGKDRIRILLMDREFIGQKWLSWLKKEKICFCVRVPKHHTILFSDGRRATAEQILSKHGSFNCSNVVVDGVSVNLSISRGKDGELLYLIGTMPATELRGWYKKRWTIEVFFQALKSRGFNLEKSCLRNLEKYRKLFAVVSMAYSICWAVGIEAGRTNPVKVKKHGYPQYSVFRRGLNIIRDFYKKRIEPIINQAIEKSTQRLMLYLKTVG
jgi:IS4 transposase